MEPEDSQLVRYWWVVGLAALVAGAITTAAAVGFPILELEFAWTAKRADEALAGADLDAVRATILWDFVFLVLYASALYLGSLWAGSRFVSDQLSKVGPYIAIGALLAGIFDFIENLAMLAHVNGWSSGSVPLVVAGVMATLKFLLVLVAIVYIVMGIVVAIARRVSDTHTS
jgi:hypothetical protein